MDINLPVIGILQDGKEGTSLLSAKSIFRHDGSLKIPPDGEL